MRSHTFRAFGPCTPVLICVPNAPQLKFFLPEGTLNPYGLLSQMPQKPLPPFLIPLKIFLLLLLLLLLLISSHPGLLQPWPSPLSQIQPQPSLLSRILPLPLKTFPPQSAHTSALA